MACSSSSEQYQVVVRSVRLYHRAVVSKRRMSAPSRASSVISSEVEAGLIRMILRKPHQLFVLLRRTVQAFQETYGPRHPSVASAYKLLGCAFTIAGDFKNAATSFENARSIVARKFGAISFVTSDILYNVGVLHMRKMQYQRAIDVFEEALLPYETAEELTSQDLSKKRSIMQQQCMCRQLAAETTYNDQFERGIDALMGGETTQAQLCFERCMECRPGDPTASYNMAATHAQAGDVAEALDWLKRARAAGCADVDSALQDARFEGVSSDSTFLEGFRSLCSTAAADTATVAPQFRFEPHIHMKTTPIKPRRKVGTFGANECVGGDASSSDVEVISVDDDDEEPTGFSAAPVQPPSHQQHAAFPSHPQLGEGGEQRKDARARSLSQSQGSDSFRSGRSGRVVGPSTPMSIPSPMSDTRFSPDSGSPIVSSSPSWAPVGTHAAEQKLLSVHSPLTNGKSMEPQDSSEGHRACHESPRWSRVGSSRCSGRRRAYTAGERVRDRAADENTADLTEWTSHS